MVAFPFFFMLFAILEIALIFTIDSVLDSATTEAGRLIRTGQAGAQSMTKLQFREEVCERMTVFEPGCLDQLTVDVQVVPQFDVILDDPVADGDLDDSETGYTNGAPADLMLVRVWYQQPLVTAFLAPGLTELGDGTHVLTAATAFRNEPA